MNKYLLMSAAAAVAATAGSTVANATTTVHFTRSGVSFCDYFKISGPYHLTLYAAKHYAPECGTSHINDAGNYDAKPATVPGKVKPGVVQFADSDAAYSDGLNNGADFVLSYPFGTGGTWAFVYTTNGVTAVIANAGNQTSGADANRAKSGKSIMSDAIQAMNLSRK